MRIIIVDVYHDKDIIFVVLLENDDEFLALDKSINAWRDLDRRYCAGEPVDWRGISTYLRDAGFTLPPFEWLLL